MNFMCLREMSVRQFISFFAAATPVVLCGLAALLSATPACAVGMLIEACRKNNSFNARLAVETLHNIQYAGISGSISFAPDGSKNNPPYTLYRAAQNKWQIVKVFGG